MINTVKKEPKEKGKEEDKKAAALKVFAGVMSDLESLFNEVPKKDAQKIASITKYIHTLCTKLS